MGHVQEALAAWRAAERELEAATDPRERERLTALLAERHKAYREALELAGALEDVLAHSHDEAHRPSS